MLLCLLLFLCFDFTEIKLYLLLFTLHFESFIQTHKIEMYIAVPIYKILYKQSLKLS